MVQGGQDRRHQGRVVSLAEQRPGPVGTAGACPILPERPAIMIYQQETDHRSCPSRNRGLPPIAVAELAAHCVKPELTYLHNWRQHDLVMWDDCSTQHKATFDYPASLPRLMHRTTVVGTIAR